MNPKYQKVCAEIAKTEKKVEDLQGQLKELYDKKTELENLEIVNTVWCCTIKVDIENSKGQYIEKDKQEATKDGSESTKIQHGI